MLDVDHCNNSKDYEHFYNSESILYDNNISAINNKELNFHFLCKECGQIPKLFFLNNGRIKLICKKERVIFIEDILNYLDTQSFKENKLKCPFHNKKFIYYCKQCKRNLCDICMNDCSKHNKIKEIVCLKLYLKVFDKIAYIQKKMKKEKNYFFLKIQLF